MLFSHRRNGQKEHEVCPNAHMYSKMGRYISNKILNTCYQRHVKSESVSGQVTRNVSPQLKSILEYDTFNESSYQPETKEKIRKSRQTQKVKHKREKVESTYRFYKVSYQQVDKNIRSCNFQKSVPHFSREKFSCNESSPCFKNFPDVSSCRERIKGLVDLNRIGGRNSVKQSYRSYVTDPHETRFTLKPHHTSFPPSQHRQAKVKTVGVRSQKIQPTPIYNVKYDGVWKNLNTHMVKFSLQTSRKDEFLHASKGIGEQWEDHEKNQQYKTKNVPWNRCLERRKRGEVPLFMDKNIHSRGALQLVTLKTLEMNCTQLKKPQKKVELGKRNKKKMYFQLNFGGDKTPT